MKQFYILFFLFNTIVLSIENEAVRYSNEEVFELENNLKQIYEEKISEEKITPKLNKNNSNSYKSNYTSLNANDNFNNNNNNNNSNKENEEEEKNDNISNLNHTYKIRDDQDYPGLPCFDLENKLCSINFKELGPVSYHGFKNCFIYNPFSGIVSKEDYQKNNILFDFNAVMGCIINRQLFGYIQYVNIKIQIPSVSVTTTPFSTMYNFNLHSKDSKEFKLDSIPDTISLPENIILVQSTNFISIDNDINLIISLSDCNDIWTVRMNQENIQCNTIPIISSTDGRCGLIDHKVIAMCQEECCGEDGRCGTTTASCQESCEPYGICGDLEGTIAKKELSTDGRCGEYNGKECPEKECCSSEGYCGTSSSHCEMGCQLAYGVCSNYFYVVSKWAYQEYFSEI